MLPYDWFGVGLRLVGVIVFLYGLALLLDSLLFRLGYFNQPETHFGYYLIFGLAYLASGLYLIWGAPQIVSLVYPGVVDEDNDEEEDEQVDDEETPVTPR